MTNSRDYSLDYLKGVGCFLMMIAHLAVHNRSDPVAVFIAQVGSLGMLYFFSTAGVTAAMQVSKYDLGALLKFFLVLALAGSCYTAMMHPTMYMDPRLEVFQIIAIGSIAVVLVEYYWHPNIVWYLILAIGVYLVKLARDIYFPEVDGAGVLFPHKDFVPWDTLKWGQKGVNPAFPLIPWLSFFFAGNVAYRVNNKLNLLLGFVFFLLALCTYLYLPQLDRFYDKWNMTPGYFLIAFGTLFISFYIGRRWFTKAPRNPNNILIFFGQNSLLFFYVHSFGLVLGFVYIQLIAKNIGLAGSYSNQYVAWLIVFVVSFYALKIGSKIKPSPRFLEMKNWYRLITLILLLPMLVFVSKRIPVITLISGLEVLLGLVFVVNFPLVARLLKKR